MIYRLKREVLEFRRASRPLAEDTLTMFMDRASAAATAVDVRHVLPRRRDHLRQVNDHVESYDRLLSDILAPTWRACRCKQNADMRKISAWVAIAAVPTMIAGIYGMNFDVMPELTASRQPSADRSTTTATSSSLP